MKDVGGWCVYMGKIMAKGQIKDLTGRKFGKLTALSYEISKFQNKRGVKQSIVHWNCLCECGNLKKIRSFDLSQGRESCGCANKSQIKFQDRKSLLIKKLYAANIREKNFRSLGNYNILSLKQFEILCQMDCIYCGRKPENKMRDVKKGRKVTDFVLYYNGLDQIVPQGGYQLENVVPCCQICNRAKNDGTVEEFIFYLKNLWNYKKDLES